MRNDVDADYGTADPISMSNPQYGNPNIQVTFPYAVLNRMEQTYSVRAGSDGVG